MNQQPSKFKVTLLWIAIATLGRLIPHPPNATPLTSLCVLSSRQFSLKTSCFMMLLSLLLSDILLAFIQHHAIFGLWSLFTYSGFLMIMFGGARFIRQDTSFLNTFIFTGFSSIGFWLWTNLGTWLTTSLYQHTGYGLLTCYAAAIPFLRNAIIADLIWLAVLQYLLTSSDNKIIWRNKIFSRYD